MTIKYIIQLIRFVNDTEDYSSRCDVQYYDRPLLFESKEEVLRWLDTYGYQKSSYRANLYEKSGFGKSQEITWDNQAVPTDYTAVVLEVDPDRKKGSYQSLALCGHAE